MKNYLILTLFLIPAFKLFSQGNVVILDAKVNPGRILTDLPLPSPELKGSNYIHDEWSIGSFSLRTGQKVENCLLKYDITNELLEINVQDVIKICPKSQLDSFRWKPLKSFATGDYVQYVNCDKLKYKDASLTGVFEILAFGEINLYLKYRTDIVKGTYVAGFDMGERDNKIVKKEDLYYEKNGLVYKLPSGKGDILDIFKDKKVEVEAYVTKEKLKLSKKEDLVELLAYYKSI